MKCSMQGRAATGEKMILHLVVFQGVAKGKLHHHRREQNLPVFQTGAQ